MILLLVAFIFIASNALVNVGSSRRYNGLLQDYQQVNGLLAINNRRQTYFKLYSKSHDEGMLKQYYDECELFDSQLRGLDEKMRNDRKCKMMYRIVGQVAEHRREMAESYIRPDGDYYPSLMADLDEVDLEIERCLNQLMSQYLEYLNTAFASHSRTLGLTNSILIVFFMAASLFGMVLNHQMSTSILNSIKRLTDAAREIMNNNLEAADIEETPYAELNQVSATFDQMKRQIRTMITELHETHQMKERLAEAKIRELQMQMNPHFLFNTLSLVIRSIQLGERDTSIQLVKAISKILRSSIEINTVSIPLDAEIELLQSYLYIQKLHLKGRVTFCLDVRKSFMDEDVMIPPLTIQPLVENSIQHGLKDRVNGGKVDILITEKPDYIEAVVADNGVGFPEDPSQPARRDTPIPKTSIGLKNVEERLRLFYRKEDVLHIQRTEGITKITDTDFKYAAKMGTSIKLFGSSRMADGKTSVFVCPMMIDRDHPLYGVSDVFNAVMVRGNMVGTLMFYGSGAGKLPTASAVVADIMEAACHMTDNVPLGWSSEKQQLSDVKEMRFRYFIRFAGSAAEKLADVEAAFGKTEIIELPGMDEFAVLTGEMTELKYHKVAAAFGDIRQMIRA